MPFKFNPLTGNLDLVNISTTDTDEKVKLDSSDPTAGYLDAKLQQGIQATLFDPTPVLPTLSTGLTYYDTAEHTLATELENGVTLQHGQEMHVYGKNVSGAPILNGQPVSIVQNNGQFTAFGITDITTPAAYAFIGLATQTIGINEFGYVTVQGKVHDIDTSYLDEGKPVYVTTDGYLTKVFPSVPNYIVNVGIVEYKHAQHGIINVIKAVIPKLADLSDVNGTATTVDGQIPTWHNTSKYFDFDKNINDYLTTANAGTTYAKLDGTNQPFTGDLKIGDNLKHYFGTGNDASIYYDGTNFQFNSREVGTGNFIFSFGNVGINQPAPTTKAHMVAEDSSGYYTTDVFRDSVNSGGFTVRRARGTKASPTTCLANDILGINYAQCIDTNGGTTYYNSAMTMYSADSNHGTGSTPGRITFLTTPSSSTTAVERMRITSTGYIGINYDTPTAYLDMKGSVLTDGPVLSTEKLTGGTWTSTDWTGDNTVGWTHTTGNTSPLSHSFAAVVGKKYQIIVVRSGGTTGTATFSIGGSNTSTISTAAGTYDFGPTASTTASFTVTPQSTFDGTIICSVKEITGASIPMMRMRSYGGSSLPEFRLTNDSTNFSIGQFAGQNITTGSANTALGYGSNTNVTTGDGNTAFGYSALGGVTTGNYNLGFGQFAGLKTTTAVDNVYIGISAGYENLTGSSNIMIGRSAGRYFGGSTSNLLSNPSGSIFIGASTYPAADSETNEIVIGNLATGIGSNTVTIGHTTITTTEIRGDVRLNADAKKFILGTAQDMSIQYDGTNGIINTSLVGASDLVITCGTDKTLSLTESVWADIDFPIIIRTTGTGIPTMATFNGNLTMPQWAVNDYNQCESQEFIHEWKEGTTCYWHIHLNTNGLDATNRYVKFELEYAYSVAGVWTFPAAVTTSDILIPANTPDKSQIIMSLANFTPTNSKIGDHCIARLKRVAATGTAPTNNPWIPMLQMHIEKNTIGSRQMTIK